MGYPLNNKRVQALYRETGEEIGLRLHSLNLGALLSEGTLNYGPETREGRWARESLVKAFEACSGLDIHTVVITVEPEEETFDHVVSHLQFASQLAKEAQGEVAIECAKPLEVIQRLLECMDEEVKLCMDTLNPLRFQTGDPREQIYAFGTDKISHIHMKDSIQPLFQKGQRGCVALGRGDGRYAEAVKALMDIGYEGWIFTENYYYLPPLNQGAADFAELAKQDLDTLKKSFGK